MVTTDEPRHPIQVVVRRTGLKPDLIRAWERRYGAVTPARGSSGRRVYSDRDVERLYLLRQAIRGGRRIGDIAGDDDDALRALIAEDDLTREVVPATPVVARSAGLRQLFDHLRALDESGFSQGLRLLSDQSPPIRFVERIVRPLLRRVGEAVRAGELRIYHEHLATVLVERRLSAMLAELNPAEGQRRVVVTTPVGQLHGLGALMAGAVAAAGGHRVLYLGVNLPAEEIAAAALDFDATHVALSVVHPPDDAALIGDLRRLRRLLPGSIAIVAGGRALQANASRFSAAELTIVEDLDAFATLLSKGRRPTVEG